MKKLFLPNLARVGLCAALFACAGLSTAQPASPDRPRPDRAPQQRPFGGGARFGGGQPGQLFPLMERVLTEDQRQSLRSAMEAQREQSREIEGKLREARRELMKTGMIDKFDEAAVRAKALEAAKLDAELTVLRAKAFSQMKPPLSAEQIEQLKNPPPFEGGEGRRDLPRRPDRGASGSRDENDLPSKQK